MKKFLMIWGMMVVVVSATVLFGVFTSWLLTTATLYAGTTGAVVILAVLITTVLAGAVYLMEEF